MRRVPIALTLGMFLSFPASSATAQEANRLTVVSNVRLRAAADEAAAVVTAVPLGTELIQLDTGGPSAAWVRVRTTGGPDGWLPARLTRRFTPDGRIEAIEAVVKDRLARAGDSFTARRELLDLVERTLSSLKEPESGGRFALLWLSALDTVAAAVPRTQSRAEPYAAWLKTHDAVVYSHELAGRWQVRQQAVLDLHARHRDTSAADDIAWFAATHGLSGECEGFVPCVVRRFDALDGTYLRLHPAGRHVDESVTRLFDGFARMDSGRGHFFDSRKDCPELATAADPLAAAIGATRAASRAAALAAIDRVRAPCK